VESWLDLLQERQLYSSPRSPTGHGAHSTTYSMCTKDYFPGIKWSEREVNHSSTSIVQLNPQSLTCRGTHNENLILTQSTRLLSNVKSKGRTNSMSKFRKKLESTECGHIRLAVDITS
jgi:hypothetical protein